MMLVFNERQRKIKTVEREERKEEKKICRNRNRNRNKFIRINNYFCQFDQSII